MKTWLKILIVLFVLGVIAAALGYIFIYNKPHPDFARAKPVFSLTAAELYEAYINSREEAEKMYNGKVIQIEGNLDVSERNVDLTILGFIFDDGFFGTEGVRCTLLPEFADAAKTLAVGDYIKLKGLCTGYTGVDVILDKCSLIE